MSSKPVLWDASMASDSTKLRPPNELPKGFSALQKSAPSTSLELNNSDSPRTSVCQQQSSEAVLEQHTTKRELNPNAVEWYPKNISAPVYSNDLVKMSYPGEPHNVSSTIQNRLKLHKPTETPVIDESGVDLLKSKEYSQDFNRIKHIISTLTKDPGQFRNLLDLFLETLEPHFEDVLAQSFIADIIVDQALNHPNFRYTGAKLCMCIEQNSPTFRAELHLKCKKNTEQHPDTRNILLFLAELYIQLPHLNVYGALLFDAFDKLIHIGGNDSIKCICQALKLTGYSLEQNNKTDLDKVFNNLKMAKNKVEGSAAILLDSILQLRSSNWGHVNEDSSDSDQDNYVLYEDSQSKVLYDIDGEQLTTEESDFIASHMSSNDEYDIDEFDPDELCDPEPEMDEEIQEAFKEFVRFSNTH